MRYHAALLLLVSLFVASAAHASFFKLTCRTPIIGGKPIEDVLTVDTDASAVNGGRAIITADAVQWGGAPPQDPKAYVRFQFNRHTGVLHTTVTRSESSTPVEQYGKCVSVQASILKLTCRTIIGGNPIDKVAIVDTDASTVNYNHAIISADELRWDEDKVNGNVADGRYSYQVNRYTGVINTTITFKNATTATQSPSMLHGECVPATERRF
jgi:hypothetical protein